MKKIMLALALMTGTAQIALAESSIILGTTASMGVLGSIYISTGQTDFGLIKFRAKDDAATFVATDGQLRGASLQHALDIIRVNNPELKASDMDIAKAILETEGN